MENVPAGNRISIFVDGANLYKSASERKVRLDYPLLKRRLEGNREVVSALYFGSYKRDPPDPDEALRDEAFQAMVREAGFEVRLRPLKVEYFGLRVPRGVEFQMKAGEGVDTRTYREKGVDVALVTEMLIQAWDDVYDTGVLVSGDNDYAAAARGIIKHGKQVEIVSFLHSAGRELIESATRFVELQKLLS